MLKKLSLENQKFVNESFGNKHRNPFRLSIRLLSFSALLFTLFFEPGAWSKQKKIKELPVIFQMAGVKCPVRKPCLCKGNKELYDWAKLNLIRISLNRFKTKTSCYTTDFNGDGILDFVIPGSEGDNAFILGGKNHPVSSKIFGPMGSAELVTEPQLLKLLNKKLPCLVMPFGYMGGGAIFCWNGSDLAKEIRPTKELEDLLSK